MSSNVILFGWNRPIPGRERLSGEHFAGFTEYLGSLQKAGKIQGFDVVFLDAHGGDLNGFILIKGRESQLDDLVSTEAWQEHTLRASFHLDGFGVVWGGTGELIPDRMANWVKMIP
jgi:hypothetical protein